MVRPNSRCREFQGADAEFGPRLCDIVAVVKVCSIDEPRVACDKINVQKLKLLHVEPDFRSHKTFCAFEDATDKDSDKAILDRINAKMKSLE
jgi:hypothetical protein